MSKINNRNSANSHAAGGSGHVVVSHEAQPTTHEHGRLAVFVEYPDKPNGHVKAKKNK